MLGFHDKKEGERERERGTMPGKGCNYLILIINNNNAAVASCVELSILVIIMTVVIYAPMVVNVYSKSSINVKHQFTIYACIFIYFSICVHMYCMYIIM